MMKSISNAHHRQNSHLTFKANVATGRHGWLRLTPAYSYRLVVKTLERSDIEARVVLDPFSGTGTTGLVVSEHGLKAHLVDVNPFLLWLAAAKTRSYAHSELLEAQRIGQEIVKEGPGKSAEGLWQPPIHRIDRWWSAPELDALRVIYHALDRCAAGESARDLLLVAFCRTLIRVSHAAFNHQSMSFNDNGDQLSLLPEIPASAWLVFIEELETVVGSASSVLPGDVNAYRGDSRDLASALPRSARIDLLYTSPPYANRISYIRELRPYMYWLGFLHDARQAGELDWTAIGGTWGIATSRVAQWTTPDECPLGPKFSRTLATIRGSNDKSGDILARYVHKYFDDMWLHFQSAYTVIKPGGKVIYIVGNSFFYGVNVPTQEWYRTLLLEAGFESVSITPIRKRNSKKGLFEYAVEGVRP